MKNVPFFKFPRIQIERYEFIFFYYFFTFCICVNIETSDYVTCQKEIFNKNYLKKMVKI